MYLRPWTFSEKMADDILLFVTKLCRTQWKQHLKGVLPHAARRLRNFMPACMADNTDVHEDNDMQDNAKDIRLRVDLSASEVHCYKAPGETER